MKYNNLYYRYLDIKYMLNTCFIIINIIKKKYICIDNLMSNNNTLLK